MIANGIDPRGLTISDAVDLVDMLVMAGRAVPAVKWVDGVADAMFNEEAAATLAGLAL